jgi:hypothetical protein
MFTPYLFILLFHPSGIWVTLYTTGFIQDISCPTPLVPIDVAWRKFLLPKVTLLPQIQAESIPELGSSNLLEFNYKPSDLFKNWLYLCIFTRIPPLVFGRNITVEQFLTS